MQLFSHERFLMHWSFTFNQVFYIFGSTRTTPTTVITHHSRDHLCKDHTHYSDYTSRQGLPLQEPHPLQWLHITAGIASARTTPTTVITHHGRDCLCKNHTHYSDYTSRQGLPLQEPHPLQWLHNTVGITSTTKTTPTTGVTFHTRDCIMYLFL
jgi:hypothetical protein